ncbi:MAG: ECF transporter S component [Peptococcaceae bacterium]|nr:ECF transporter S component [Peptococcaceae bacterium]
MTAERKRTVRLSFAALGVCLNILGSFLVMMTRLPIYGDTLGTIFVGVFCGPFYAVPCAMVSSLINASYDPFAIPFMLNGITVALFASLLRYAALARLALPVKALVVGLPSAIVSASVSAFLFGGITSASSSYIVQLLHGVFQLPMVVSVFMVQVFTDYADKFLILMLVTLIIVRIPTRIKEKV